MVRKIVLQNINELLQKFRLQDIEPYPGPWLFSETVIPTTSIDSLLSLPYSIKYQTASATPPNNLLFYTIPQGQRWELKTVYFIRLSGDGTIDRIGVKLGNQATDIAWIQVYNPAVTEQAFCLPVGLELREGDTIWGNMTAGSGATQYEMRVNVENKTVAP